MTFGYPHCTNILRERTRRMAAEANVENESPRRKVNAHARLHELLVRFTKAN